MGDLFVQGINDTTLYAEKLYSQNFTEANKKFVLSLHYNSNNSYLFENDKQELKLKAKNNQIDKKLFRKFKHANGQLVNQKKLDYMEIFTILL